MSDDDLFAAAYREHYWAVSRYIARRLGGQDATVEEVAADVFVVAWRRRAELPDPALPWLYGVARNCVANSLRGAGRYRRLLDRLAHHQTVRRTQVDEGPAADDPYLWMHGALARLSEADREILRLTAWEELNISEVATVLGCGSRAAAMRLHRARGRLRAQIESLEQYRGQQAGRRQVDEDTGRQAGRQTGQQTGRYENGRLVDELEGWQR
ncbi:RNA polymerase sigma factor [Streptomyces sp. 150FB]|uniref:RNA polymerase sigma factor n=1 Tax=Streptomyces sp. 150FB TaxID=1576605 RepID=UPI0007C7338D|nr:RNA polymerase sigma factor [Streptomyces sp. 150FB]